MSRQIPTSHQPTMGLSLHFVVTSTGKGQRYELCGRTSPVVSNAPSLLDLHGKITSANVLVSPVWFLRNSGDSMQHFAPQCLICVCHVLHPAVSFSKYRNSTESREMGAGQGWTCAMTDSHCWPLVFSYCICRKLVVSNACYKSSC